METLEELKKRIEELESSNEYLLGQKQLYERGDAKLYYALQRKMTEMANTLNKQNLESIDIESKDSKAFDRIMMILQKCETISTSASALGVIAKVTGKEEEDTRPFVDTIAESRK